MIVHIDCDSFYASCEVSFRPDLEGKPVVVANCNEADGGIILALTKEAKALGLKRGNPVFQVKKTLEKNKVAIFPANLRKYCDISKRIMQLVKEQGIIQHFTQYSIDEFFGDIPEEDSDALRNHMNKVREAILQGIGVPVSCGASTTNTLAKVATWYAKHYTGYNHLCVLQQKDIEKALCGIPAENVWGIGRAGRKRLHLMGIDTAFDFTQKTEQDVKRTFSTTGVRTWKELHGIPCIDIAAVPAKRTVSYTRTFTYMTDKLETLESYLSNYAAGAARKLRDEHWACHTITVFIATNPHRNDLPQYSNGASFKRPSPTADTAEITKIAIALLHKIYRDRYQYKRAGITLSDITNNQAIQLDLFTDEKTDLEKRKKVMQVTDSINQRYGMDKIRMAVQGYNTAKLNMEGFQPLRNQTTDIDDIITIGK